MKLNLIRLFARCLQMVAMAACSVSLFAQEFVWVQSGAPNATWQSVASSSDGTKLVAGSGRVYTSTNSGITWTPASPPVIGGFYSVATSSDGVKMVAVAYAGGIYASTNSGVTWTQSSIPSRAWRSVASSSDGSKLVAAVNGGRLYTSTNAGVTWTSNNVSNLAWYSVASSADGDRLVAAVHFGGIYTSTNSGATWMQTSAPSGGWFSVASSSDGSQLVAVSNTGGGIYISTNSGGTWVPVSGFTVGWFSVASSLDGSKLVAVAGDTGAIITSTNSGATWELNMNGMPPGYTWFSVASSSDGEKLVAGSNGGGIYTAFIPTNPPSISQQPQNLASCPRSSSVFTTAVAGTPPFVYQWRKEGTNLVDGGNVAGSTTTTLTLQNVSVSDAASYDVVVTNLVSSVTSSPAILIVGPVPAKATPIIVNGFIVGATVTDGGCGYTNSPFIVFNGQGGIGAAGYGQISDGSVTNIVITNAGSGYPSNAIAQVGPPFLPTVSITLTNTPAAKASPVITNGFIVGANVIAPGSAYTSPPAVSFSDDTGTGATAYTQISNGSVTNIVITSAGSGYSSNAAITIPPAAYLNAVIPSAHSLMLGQNYQLETANNLNLWVNFGAAFFATNSSWSSPAYWVLRDADAVFFRLRLLP